MAISRLRALSSAKRMRSPALMRTGSAGRAGPSSCRGLTMLRRQARSSERNSGFPQKAVTPASRASSSMSDQS